MKKAKLFGCALMMAVAATQLVAAPKTQVYDQIIRLTDLNDRVIQDFSQGNMGDFVVECPAGSSLPFKLTLKGEFLGLESTQSAPLYLNVLKTCYVRCEEKENFLFSTDLRTWKNFSEFFTGELRVSVEAENGGPIAGLQFELNQRKN
jgi:hypothetical protein